MRAWRLALPALPGLPAVIAAVALLAVVAGCRRQPPAAMTFPGAPIVLISIDTLRSDHLPAYGYRGVATPAVDALRRDALLFERAYCHYPMTLPSHVSLLSGELPPVSGVRDNSGFPFDSSRHSYLPRLLGQGGYDTAAVVSASVLAAGTGLAGGFDVYDDRMPPAAGLGTAAKRPGTDSVRAALAWVRGRAAGHPFFLFLHLYEPHAPYDPPEPFASRYRASPYDGAIAAADAAVGELLRELARLGIYDRAVVMLLSDHGEGLGEHGEQQHGTYLYRTTLQVPLLLKLPRSLLAGGSVRAPAQLIDVAPTLARLAGVPVPPGLAGENLLELVGAAPGAGARPIYAETLGPRLHFGWSELTSLIEGRLHLEDGPEPELFDLAADPGETRNRLAGERRAFAAMRQAIRGIYRPPAPPRPADAETARRLASLGYVATAGTPAQGPLPDPRRRHAELATLDAAMAAIEQRRWAAAAPLLQRLLAANPRMPDVHILLGTVWERLGRDRDAGDSYRRAVAAADGSPVTALVAARALLQLGHVEEARSLAPLARGGDPVAVAALAVDLDLAGGGLDGALAELRRAGGVPGRPGGRTAPGLAAQQRAVGLALVEAGRSEEALSLLEPLASGGDPALLDALAVALADGGRDAEAAAAAGRVLAVAPRDARAHQVLGTVALRREQVAEARRQLELAVELDPRLAVAWNTLGVARLRLLGPGAALEAWRRAVEIAPDYWEALYNVGLASAEVGRKGEAREALERFVEKAPPELFAAEIAKARTVLGKIGG
jgi:arylsulfatase A-like enzyme/regulator of sirC expression with transglutaminase-like and TPR domain